jgi:hypothetical protein
VYLKPQIVEVFTSAILGLKVELKRKKKNAKISIENYHLKRKL